MGPETDFVLHRTHYLHGSKVVAGLTIFLMAEISVGRLCIVEPCPLRVVFQFTGRVQNARAIVALADA